MTWQRFLKDQDGIVTVRLAEGSWLSGYVSWDREAVKVWGQPVTEEPLSINAAYGKHWVPTEGLSHA